MSNGTLLSPIPGRTDCDEIYTANEINRTVTWNRDSPVVGLAHPGTLETMNDFGVLRREQQHCEEAETLLLEAVEGRRLKLSDKHPHTQQSLNNLIELYEAWGKPEQAYECRARLPRSEVTRE